MITGLYGCDNVAWGGIDMELRPPPQTAAMAAADTVAEPGDPAPAPLPEGPVLYLVRADGAGASMMPVGEIRSDSLLPLPTEDEVPGFSARYTRERLVAGREFVLFREGARAGRFSITGAPVQAEGLCRPRPSVPGVIEVVPAAAQATSFLALPADVAAERPYDTIRSLASNRSQRTESIRLFGELLNQTGARWPADLVATRAQIELFPLAPSATAPTMTATFLFRDQLSVGPVAQDAYSAFVLAEPNGGGYRAAYTLYRPVERDGKGAPQVIGTLDWDGDGMREILLEVLGSDSRWFAALDRRGPRWSLVHEDACGRAAAPTTGGD